jgi:hypothetical protein
MLETEIKNLTKQIEQLNNNFAQFFSSAAQKTPVQAPKSDQLETPEQSEESEESRITPDTLRDLCMVKSREGLKVEVRAILTDLGAKVVDDLSHADLIKAYEKIGAL